MASTVKETVRVESLGKWGPKVGNEFYGWSKQIKEADKGKVVPGGEYLMDIYIADSGKKYINSVLSALAIGNPVPKAVAKGPEVKPATPVASSPKGETMSKAEWSAKDRSQLIGGLSHDAAAIASALATVNCLTGEQALKEYRFLLEGMMSIREELK